MGKKGRLFVMPKPPGTAAREKASGVLFVVSGPSGAGKGTLCRELVNQTGIALSVSMTTRAPRMSEVEGEDYFFVTKSDFRTRILMNGFLEYAEVFGNFYGTPRAPVVEKLQTGRDLMLEIDTLGAAQVKKSWPSAVFIFILPPSMRELRNRIVNRGMDSGAVIETRLGEAMNEIERIENYDYFIVNERVDNSVAAMAAIIRSEHARVAGNEALRRRIEGYKEENHAISVD